MSEDDSNPERRVWPLPFILLGVAALVLVAVLATSCGSSPAARDDRAPDKPAEDDDRTDADKPVGLEHLVPKVHARYPHDPRAFTQGLLWAHGRVFESTGLRGQSTLREVELETGVVKRQVDNEAGIFAEGLTLVDKRFIQLSWLEQRAFVWNLADFALLKEFRYEGEGWGLCYDGKELVMSDGSATLTFRDPSTFDVLRTLPVTREGKPQKQLNELECAQGKVFANVWQSDEIVRIDPRDGHIDGVIDAAGLLNAEDRMRTDVLNGIAFVPESGHFLVTGKLWPALFEVSFEAAK